MFRIALGEHVLFLRLQHRELADLVEITIEASLSGGNGRQGITGHDCAPSYSRFGSFWGRICAPSAKRTKAYGSRDPALNQCKDKYGETVIQGCSHASVIAA
ncbi:hypothetical protein RHSP_24104 [Rhizobium freirei PRF 81]|uniref:Uncharacterized protein n=1 Tax=Rhizobium freirei PRF 81 TaxID=363754 RepID=N6V857_9HYPH|nr:hypothetical protein RHSP_24104 [Rhizobium freirei PRF 81]